MNRNLLVSLLAIFSLSTIYFFLSFLGERREVQSLRTKNQTQKYLIDSLVNENYNIRIQLIRQELFVEDYLEKFPEQKDKLKEVISNEE